MSTIEVKNLVLYKINQQRNNAREYVPLIKSLDTKFESGKLNVIMGPNGSSKTTFLDLLYGKCEPSAKTSGKILYNGKERDFDEWFSNVSYSEQDCYAIEDQTVMEAIRFSMSLQEASGEKNKGYIETNVQELIKNLQLEKVKDSKISVISGGERKRTMMAIEMVRGKRILILDEPTSDLDTHLAYKVTGYLKRLAKDHDLMIIMTVHQPSPQLFKIFDNFLFMYKGMKVYSGPVSEIAEAMGSKGIVKPEDWTVADFLFEAFGEVSSFESIEALKPQVRKYLQELDSKWRENSAELHQRNEAMRFGRFNPRHAWLIAKRQFFKDVRSKHILIRMLTIVAFHIGVIYLVLSGLMELPEEVKLMMLFGMFKSFKAFYILMEASSTLAGKALLSKEISKNFYSPLSLCVSTLAIEVASNLAIVAIVLLGISIIRFDVVSIHLVAILLTQAVLTVPTALLLELLKIKISEFNAAAGKIFGFLKILFAPPTFITSIPIILAGYFHLSESNADLVSRVVAWMVIPLSPSYLMDMFTTSFFGGNIEAHYSSVLKLLTGRDSIGTGWLLGGIAASLVLVCLLVSVLFAICFSPQVRLRMSADLKSPTYFFGKRGSHYLTGKARNQKWLWGMAMASLLMVGSLAFTFYSLYYQPITSAIH